MDFYGPANKFLALVVDPIVRLMFVVAVFYFVFGVVKYIINGDDATARVEGGKHILYSTIGIFVMASAWGIISLIKSLITN
jgi:hypothetical protein